MHIKKIYYLGNPYFPGDELAIKVCEDLKSKFKDIAFEYLKDTFQLLDLDFTDCILIDVANGAQKVCLIDSDRLLPGGNSTTHDFDVGFFFSLTEKKAKLIVIPKEYNLDKAKKEAESLILDLQNRSS